MSTDFSPGDRPTALRSEGMAIIGKRNVLSVVRQAPPGLYLDGGELGEILLPARYIPRGVAMGDNLAVFVYRDSEDRLVATTETPLATVGEFACLKVVSVNQQVGAFLDWGLAKDLLLPFREQEFPVHVGQHLVVFVFLDPTSQRIVATTRLSRHLSRELPPYRKGQAVRCLVTGRTSLGYGAVVENTYRGFFFQDKLTAPLMVGQRVKGFVRAVRAGGKLDLSLDASGYQRVAPLTDQIVQALEHNGGKLAYDDDSSPVAVRQKFGVSKKAFKQALGRLYKARRIRFRNPGIELLDNASWKPGD